MSEMPLRYDEQSADDAAQKAQLLDSEPARQAARDQEEKLGYTVMIPDNEPDQHQRATRMMLKEIIETVLFILLAFFIVRGMVQNFRIEGHSMDPTLHDGQYILVNKLVYFHFDLNAPLRILPGKQDLPPKMVYPFHMPRRGDVVVFHAPEEQRDYIKRVIGLPGEHVVIQDGKVFIDGTEIEESYLLSPTTCDGFRPTCDLVVPEGKVYVLGDNRPNSSDSRSWEALPLENVIGQAWLSYWPQEHWGFITTPSYAIGNR